MPVALPDTLLGRRLYGEGASDEDIAGWFADEQRGYFDLVQRHYFDGEEEYRYEYAALNELHAFRYLGAEHFGTCLALGCARGDDVATLAPLVDRFLCIEPATKWWRDSVGGKPAEFRQPTLRGKVDADDGSVDLAVSLGVLHHIPNVSEVIAEVGRLVRPGGVFLLREPITSMGDFRKPRVGLTRNERGIPHGMLEGWLKESGFTIERRSFCMVNALRLLSRIGLDTSFNNPRFTRLDAVASWLLRPNIAYWRGNKIRKLAPSSAFFLGRKR